MLIFLENNGTEEIGLLTPTPGANLNILMSIDWFVPVLEQWPVYNFVFNSTVDTWVNNKVIITSNDAAASFWRHNDGIITPCVITVPPHLPTHFTLNTVYKYMEVWIFSVHLY